MFHGWLLVVLMLIVVVGVCLRVAWCFWGVCWCMLVFV